MKTEVFLPKIHSYENFTKKQIKYARYFRNPKVFSISKGGDFYMFDCDSKSKYILHTSLKKKKILIK